MRSICIAGCPNGYTFNISHIFKIIRNEIRNKNRESLPYKPLLRISESKGHTTQCPLGKPDFED